MDKNGKSRHSVWLTDDVWQEVDALYKLDNCPTRNEFVEKALRQYCGRLHAERTGAYLPHAMQEVLEGTLGVFGDRLGRLLFKLAVEQAITMNVVAATCGIGREQLEKLSVISGQAANLALEPQPSELPARSGLPFVAKKR